MKKPIPAAVLLAALFTASALFAYEAGGFAYTKRVETKLLAEPRPMAERRGLGVADVVRNSGELARRQDDLAGEAA